MNWYVEVLKKYAQFQGRARRTEYWMFTLINFLICMGLSFIDAALGAPISILYSLGVLIPGLAVAVRRLHDTDRSGWWLLISLIPFVGAVVLIVFLAQDSQPGDNQFGANPKAVAA